MSLSRGIAWLLLAVTMFVTMDSIAKFMTVRFSVTEIVWARYFFHLVAMLPILVWYGPWRVATTARPGFHFLRSVALLGSSLLFNLGLRQMPLATVTAIIYSSPLIITAIAALFLNEKVGLGRWVAVMVGFVGVIVVARPTSDSFDAVVLFPLGAALCYSVYQLATRALSVRDGPLTTVFWTGLGGCLVISPALPWTWQAPDVAGWALLATYGVLGFTSHFTLVLAYRHASASVLAPFFYVQLVLAIVAGVVFFHSFPDAWTFFGILLICGSGIYVWYSQRRQRGGAATRDNSS